MAYNSRRMIRDVENQPTPQYYNPISDNYEVVQGLSGKLKVILVDENGGVIQSQNLINQINAKLDVLIGVINRGL